MSAAVDNALEDQLAARRARAAFEREPFVLDCDACPARGVFDNIGQAQGWLLTFAEPIAILCPRCRQRGPAR